MAALTQRRASRVAALVGAFVRRAPLPVPRLCERFAAVKYGSRSLSARAGKQLYELAGRARGDGNPHEAAKRFSDSCQRHLSRRKQ